MDYLKVNEKEKTKYRSGTPNCNNEVPNIQAELKELKKIVNEAKTAFSGQSSPVSTKANSDFPEESTFQILTENFSLKKKVKQLEAALSETLQSSHFNLEKDPEKPFKINQNSPKQSSSYKSINDLLFKFLNTETHQSDLESELKAQIKHLYGTKVFDLFKIFLIKIQKLQNELNKYSKLIDSVYLSLVKHKLFKVTREKVEEIEIALKDRKECEVLLKGLSMNEEIRTINAAGKELIEKTYGKYFLKIVEKYQHSIDGCMRKEELGQLIDFLVTERDKARVLRFIDDGDVESAACIVRNVLLSSALESRKIGMAEN